MKEKAYLKSEFYRSLLYPFVFIAIAYILITYTDYPLFKSEDMQVYFGVGIVGLIAVSIIIMFQYIWLHRKRRKH